MQQKKNRLKFFFFSNLARFGLQLQPQYFGNYLRISKDNFKAGLFFFLYVGVSCSKVHTKLTE